MPAKKTQTQAVATHVYRVRILAPDSATKWVPTQLLAIEVEEVEAKPAARKRPKGQAPSGSGQAEAA
jgi:hypothetical protein